MKELEVKILEIDVDSIVSDLEDMGAELVYDGDIIATYYDTPSRKLKTNDCAVLRVRRRDDCIEFAYKKKLEQETIKIMEELEVTVSNYRNLDLLLKAVGFVQVKELTKHRISFKYDCMKFEIDTFEGIPPFMEIEGPSEKMIKNYAKKLGFSKKKLLPWTQSQVLRHYKNK